MHSGASLRSIMKVHYGQRSIMKVHGDPLPGSIMVYHEGALWFIMRLHCDLS